MFLRKRNPIVKDNPSEEVEEDDQECERPRGNLHNNTENEIEIATAGEVNAKLAKENGDLPKGNLYPDLSELRGKQQHTPCSPLKGEVENGPDDNGANNGHRGKESASLNPRMRKNNKATVISESANANQIASGMDGKKKTERTSYNGSKGNNHFSPFCYLCVIVTIFLLCIYSPQLVNVKDYFLQPEHNGHSNNFASEAEFDANLSSIKKTFNNQNEYFWKTLKTLGSIHLQNVQNRRVQRPLVFTLVSTKSNQRSLDCIAEKIGGVFTCGKPHVFRSHNFTESRNQKSKLDTTVNDALLTDEKVVVFHELNAFSYKVASLFFKYCDSEETPFPDAVFVFTVALDKDVGFLGNNRKVVEREVERYLMNEAWKDGIQTKTSALLLRVDEVPIIVFEEDDQLIKNQCNI